MNDFIVVTGICLTATVFSLFLKSGKMPVFSVLIGLSAGITAILVLLPKIIYVIGVFNDLVNQSGMETVYYTLILKIVAICYLAEFMEQICRDSGENSMAMKIDLAAKITVMVMAVPVVVSVLQSVLRILP